MYYCNPYCNCAALDLDWDLAWTWITIAPCMPRTEQLTPHRVRNPSGWACALHLAPGPSKYVKVALRPPTL